MSNIGNKDVFAQNLKHYMETKGKTQKELSEILGVSTSTFNDWVKAKKYPRIDKIEVLANYFGILKSDLIEEKTQERRQMQQKNDALSDIILLLRSDDEFFSMVETLSKLDAEKRAVVNSVMCAFSKVEK